MTPAAQEQALAHILAAVTAARERWPTSLGRPLPPAAARRRCGLSGSWATGFTASLPRTGCGSSPMSRAGR